MKPSKCKHNIFGADLWHSQPLVFVRLNLGAKTIDFCRSASLPRVRTKPVMPVAVNSVLMLVAWRAVSGRLMRTFMYENVHITY